MALSDAAQMPADLHEALRPHRDRNTLVRTVKALLRGSGLDIRELANELVISNPGHPEMGRIYVTYASGEVSLRLPLWNYLGYLEGYGGKDKEPELRVDADKIIAALGGRPVKR
ncbi:MAG: hypothetical protein ACRD3O_22840 [Terriglobia bacterium]